MELCRKVSVCLSMHLRGFLSCMSVWKGEGKFLRDPCMFGNTCLCVCEHVRVGGCMLCV